MKNMVDPLGVKGLETCMLTSLSMTQTEDYQHEKSDDISFEAHNFFIFYLFLNLFLKYF